MTVKAVVLTIARKGFPPLCPSWELKTLNIESGGAEATDFVATMKILMLFQSPFQSLARCILLHYYRTFYMF